MKQKSLAFEEEVARIMPLILREATRNQETVFSKGDLVVNHVVILELLFEKGPCTMTAISGALNLTMSAATAIIDKMIEHKYVNREHSQKDRRIVNVFLLKKGEDLAREVTVSRKRVIHKMFSVLTDHERLVWLGLLEKVYTGIRG